MRNLYPIIMPNFEGKLIVTHLHTLYYAEYGNPNGIPVVYCHGGPGGATEHHEARYYDPEKYRIILFHQRGSGKSIPFGELTDNHTQALIDDLELLRNKLIINRWVVAGGSWGSTLALLYAQKYPQQVYSLILRSVFLARQQDIDYTRINNPPVANKATEKYLAREIYILSLMRERKKMALFGSANDLNIAHLVEHYMKNKCFISENAILENAYKISHIPIYIVHGEQDYNCSPNQSKRLANTLKALGNKNVILQLVEGGHSMREATLIDGLVSAAEEHYALLSFPKMSLRSSL
jgi:proline iminopeptidase